MTQPSDSWEASPARSGLVFIGTHSLYLSISGPIRKPNQPIVIVFTGSGDTSRSYTAVSRLLNPTARLLLYDRTGLGQSENGPNRINSVVAAQELHALLLAAAIPPPYVLLGHSYGGMIAREFLHLYSDTVVGMILADASTERQCQYFKIPDPNFVALLGSLNYAQVTGLRAASQITRDEWRARAAEYPRGLPTALMEAEAFTEICETLASHQQYETQALGERPLSVIRCDERCAYVKVYEAGVAAGNGSEEEREGYREMLRTWELVDAEMKEEQVKLSNRTNYVFLEGCEHNVQLVRPDVVAAEVRWVLENTVEEGIVEEGKVSSVL